MEVALYCASPFDTAIGCTLQGLVRASYQFLSARVSTYPARLSLELFWTFPKLRSVLRQMAQEDLDQHLARTHDQQEMCSYMEV